MGVNQCVYDFGYGQLENELIECCTSVPVDFDKAKQLIELGADVNATLMHRIKTMIMPAFSAALLMIFRTCNAPRLVITPFVKGNLVHNADTVHQIETENICWM